MKYVKTFESYSEEMEAQQALEMPSGLTPNSPEIEEITAKIAKKKGLDVEEVIAVQDEMKKEPMKTNEEEEPFTIGALVAFVVGPLVIGGAGFVSAKISEHKGLKRYVEQESRKRVEEMIKKDPTLVSKLETLVEKTYDELMADKNFIDNVKKSTNLIGYGREKGGVTFGTAGRY
jgi:hypothetical protein